MEEITLVKSAPLDWNFIGFVIDSNFYYKNNLKLAYFLIHAQSCSVSEAARALKRSRVVIYEKCMFNNPCFTSIHKSVGSEEGGHQRRIEFSEIGMAYIEQIEALSIKRIGDDECHRLRGLAEKVRRTDQKDIKRKQKSWKVIKERHSGRGEPVPIHIQEEWASILHCTVNEL